MKILKSKLFWTVLSVTAFLAAIFSLMPKPIDMNLERIGKGKKAVVFVYDLNLAASHQQTTEINKAQSLVGDQAVFLIVNIGDPTAEAFRTRYQVRSLDILLFNGGGELVDRDRALLSAEGLTAWLSGI